MLWVFTTNAAWYDDRPFDERILTAVYFGLHTPIEDKKTLIEIVKEQYPHTKIYQACAVKGKYDIEFSRVSTRKASR